MAGSVSAPGLGIDLVPVPRFRQSVEDGGQAFLDKVFTPAEQEACLTRKDPYPSLAARFAAKEAVMKALGTGWGAGVRFRDVEVEGGHGHPPRLTLHGRAAELAGEAGLAELRLSLSHTEDLATAIVLGLDAVGA